MKGVAVSIAGEVSILLKLAKVNKYSKTVFNVQTYSKYHIRIPPCAFDNQQVYHS